MSLPIYKVVIDEEGLGIDKISLVEYPAVECNFLTFSKEEKKVLLSIDNEEQRIITGVVARCDYPIYRREDNGYEYYIVFDRELIKQMAIKMLSDNHQNNPKGFDDISNGSLMVTYKVFNDEVWQSVKNGTYKGFSLEGVFVMEKTETNEEGTLNEIMSMLDELDKIIKK